MAKQRVKNKQELSPKSGTKPKIEYKDKIIFEFESEGVKYKNGGIGRIKIDKDGIMSFLIKIENKWKGVKGKILKLKVVQVKKTAGYGKKSASKRIKKMPLGLSTASKTK